MLAYRDLPSSARNTDTAVGLGVRRVVQLERENGSCKQAIFAVNSHSQHRSFLTWRLFVEHVKERRITFTFWK